MHNGKPVTVHLFDDHGHDFLFKGLLLAEVKTRMPGYPPLSLNINIYSSDKAFYAWVIERNLAHAQSGVCHATVCHSTRLMPEKPLETRSAFRRLSQKLLLETLEKEYPHANLQQQLEQQLQRTNNTSTGMEP